MLKQIKAKIKKLPPLLYLIVFLASIFRFWNLGELFPFGMDQEYELFLVKNIVNGINIPLIGVNASDTGIYLGPIFIYFTVIPYILFFGNPIGLAITASLIGVITTLVLFKTAKEMLSPRIAYFASFLYAASFLASFYDRNYWNPTPVPILSILIGYSLYKINSGNYKFLYYLSIFFGLSLHSHLSLLIFTPLIIWIILKKIRHIKKKILIASLLIFLTLQLTQIIFEFRHGFTNTKAIAKTITQHGENNFNYSLEGRVRIFIDYLGRFIFVPFFPDVYVEKGLCSDLAEYKRNAYPEVIGLCFLLIIFFAFLHFRFLNKNKNKNNYFASNIVIAVFILGMSSVFIYSHEFKEYYLQFMTPYLAILLGIPLSYLWDKAHGREVVLSFFAIYLLINFITLLTSSNSYSLSLKKKVINFAKIQTKDNSYALEALGDCPRFEGWQYLFEYYNRKPKSSYMDSYFRWLYQQKNDTSTPGKIVLLSMIDSRANTQTIAKWEEDKINYLTSFNILAQSVINNIQIYILTPKK